jgi:hypothetical protein
MLREEYEPFTAAPTHLAADDGKEAAVWRPGNERLAGRTAAEAPRMPLNIMEGAAGGVFAGHTSNCKCQTRPDASQAIGPSTRSSASLRRRHDVLTVRCRTEGFIRPVIQTLSVGNAQRASASHQGCKLAHANHAPHACICMCTLLLDPGISARKRYCPHIFNRSYRLSYHLGCHARKAVGA